MQKTNFGNKIKQSLFIITAILLGIAFFEITQSRVAAISTTGWTVNGQNTIFDGTGNVGIGSQNPNSKFEIGDSGGLTFKSLPSNPNIHGNIVFRRGDNNAITGNFWIDNNSTMYMSTGNPSTNEFIIKEGGWACLGKCW